MTTGALTGGCANAAASLAVPVSRGFFPSMHLSLPPSQPQGLFSPMVSDILFLSTLAVAVAAVAAALVSMAATSWPYGANLAI